MLLSHRVSGRPARRGVILMVVLALLTLFAIVGITFVLYADAEARGSQLNREAEVNSSYTVDPGSLLQYGLSQLLFDADSGGATGKAGAGIYSAMRGQSVGRNMYGYNDDPNAAVLYGYTNAVPYNGVGRIHNTSMLTNYDDYNVVNYTYYPQADYINTGGKSVYFIYDPERLGPRQSPPQPGPVPGGFDPGSFPPETTNPFYGFNVPYTYPDWNNLYLAQQGPDGTPYQPSFHRSWSAFGSLDPSNPNWYATTPGQGNTWAHAVLRPRPIDQLLQGETWPPNRPYFPPPEDAGGDVKNRTGAPGGNDSFWMDLDYPVLTAPDGTLYKPLFAFYVLDLDGRVNVNVHGNIANGGNPSSNLGWGPWTVNPAQVFTLDAPPQSTTLLAGNNTYIGRYGQDKSPSVLGTSLLSPMGTTPISGPLTNVPFYSQVDFKGLAAAPLVATGTASSSFPTWPAGYDQANNPINDFQNHPGLYNPYLPAYNPVTQQLNSDDHPFASSNMEYMARGPFDSGASSLSAEVLNLLPKSMTDQTIPNLATGLSFDVDRPGISPYFNFVAIDYTLQNMVIPPAPPAPPSGSPPITYPVANGINPATINSLPNGPLNQPSDFQQTDWRSLAAVLGRIDLNRSLPAYPPSPADWSTGAAATQFQVATIARQDFARDIFTRLVAATMGMQPDYIDINPSTGKPGYWAQLGPNNTKLAVNYPDPVGNPTQYNALIWLAQLAANIVDYIDNDDIMTVFFWNPDSSLNGGTDRVIGTELPRLLLNEVYLEWQNPAKKVGAKGTSTNATVNAWVELYNPLNKDTVSNLPLQGGAMLYNAANNTSCYQLQICKQYANVSTPGQQIRYWIQNPQNPNVEGNVGAGQSYATTAGIQFSASPIAIVPPSNGAVNGGGNSGYFVVGNSANFKGPPGGGPAAPVDFQTAMNYTETVFSDGLNWLAPPAPTVVLQRLACPYLPNNGSPANPATYNPYVTVDYLEYACYNGQGPNPVYPANKEGQYLVWQNNSYGPPINNAATARQSDGRKDPYRGLYSPPAPPQVGNRAAQAAVANQPAHTLGAQNSSLNNPLFWLPQMDRALVSPMELLQVSSVPPSLLAQEFGNPFGNAAPGPNAPLGLYDHRAPWFDEDNPTNSGPPVTPQSHLLYRFFEFVSTRSQMSAVSSTSALGGGLVGPPSTLSSAAIAVGPNQTVTPKQMWVSGSSGVPLQIRQGDVVIIDLGLATQENVRVTAATTNSFTATFLVAHGNNASITPTILGDRLPGKINLNSVWDQRVLNALVDPQAGNYFANPPSGPALNLNTTFTNFLNTRSPNTMSAMPTPSVSQVDQPLMGMGSGLYQTGAAPATMPYPGTYQQTNGISVGNTTFFMRDRTNPNYPLFSFPEDNVTPPLNRYELISKMANNITPRSNVFAVWMTVGFFQVLPDPTTGKLTPKPYILGAEIGKSENKNVRRRMFAIVDRSSLMANINSVPTIIGGPPVGTWPRGFPLAVTTLSMPSAANTSLGCVTAISGTSTLPLASPPSGAITWGVGWNLTNQQILVIDAGTPQEEFVTVNVGAVPLPNFQIAGKFQFNHAAGATVTLGALSNTIPKIPYYQTMVPGNPGPKPFFDANVNPGIVRYMSIIQ